jgi:hypothetical protein
MNRSAVSFTRVLTFLVAVAATVVVSACSEKLEAGNACPIVCPSDQIDVKDTIITSVEVDTTVVGFPSIGNEDFLLLADLGDTLDTRVIVRFDTLPTLFRKAGSSTDSTITTVDSARLNLRILHPEQPTAPFTIDVFDVDTAATDTAAAPVLARFRDDVKIASYTFDPAADSLGDTIKVPLPNQLILDRLTAGARLRLGIRLTSSQSLAFRVLSQNLGTPSNISFRATPDTSTAPVVVSPESRTPEDPSFLRFPLADYVVVAKGTPPPPESEFAVGGYPSRRTYLRFDIPRRILDSTTVIRASLILQQAPFPESPGAQDSLPFVAVPVIASGTVTDLRRALGFLSNLTADTLRLIPAGTGERRVELVGLVRLWSGTEPEQTPRAIALVGRNEGDLYSEIRFYSSEASDPALRPQLQITYVPSVNIGLP